MKKITLLSALCAGAALLPALSFGAQGAYKNDFSNPKAKLELVGRGDTKIAGGSLFSKDNYACFGDKSLKNYSFSFKARAPKDAEQVQIWAGFRNNNRFDRYVVGIKGGLLDQIYLLRLGYMGTDEFLATRPLRFHPEVGQWYKVKVDVCGNRIRVFINDENVPRIDVVDANSGLAPSGGVTLGGSWINTEFDDLEIKPLPDSAFDGVKKEEFEEKLTAAQKEEKRKAERAKYKIKKLAEVKDGRTEISLDGDWLFMPEYELKDKNKAVSTSVDDQNWHVMPVPSFWNPIRIWLHGETMKAANGHEAKGVSDKYYQSETDRCANYTFDYKKTGAAWYRQWVELPKEIEGKRLELHFDAVSKVADVYINGELAGSHIGMFGDFRIDATGKLKPGRNLIAVNVIRDIKGAAAQTSEAMENYYSSVRKEADENKDDKIANKEVLVDIPHGFYGDNPAGIWQPVKLVVSDNVKIQDAYIKPSLSGADFEITVKNNSQKKRGFNVALGIFDKTDGKALYSAPVLKNLKLDPGAEKTFSFDVKNLKPKLWEPASPNLYDFKFRISDGKSVLDELNVVSGFRTFEARKDGYLYLNGRKFWLRGGNHIPFALRPNDAKLADKFMQLMKEGNVQITRTHTTPWNELWVSAADRNGIGISFEGTWSWLMIHSTPIPNDAVMNLWRTEWLQVIKKYRNHPSVLFWTTNNEMKFYHNDTDLERAKKKFTIISDVTKETRKLDPTRPICFDSNYMRRGMEKRFGKEFFETVDDGDIDDNHGYYNWYDHTVFKFFNGEFQNSFKTEGRPLISQEMSTGYPNNETGHPTRSYQLIHQNPFTLIGYKAYDFANPNYFLKTQAFTTGELAETLRRTNEKASGIMHFAYMTWFRQCYDAENIAPYPTYFAMQRAMQPVLVSAELWGRNAYAGEKLFARVYVVNDSEDGKDLPPSKLNWTIESAGGKVLASGSETFPKVPYYGRQFIEPEIKIPEIKPEKMNAKLKFALVENGKTVSKNEYDLFIAKKQWSAGKIPAKRDVVLLDGDGAAKQFDFLGIKYRKAKNVSDLLAAAKPSSVLAVSGLSDISGDDAAALRAFQKKGGRLLLLNCKETAKKIYPEYITSWIIPTEGDIVLMEREDASVFDQIPEMQLRYFNNNKREIPRACNATLKVARDKNVVELAGQMKIHAYIDGGKPEDRIKKIESMRGFPLVQINDGKGRALVSTMATEKADTDPVAGRLLSNMVKVLVAE
ncbi:MAG: hypothetical protein IKS15_04100 [Opitutales bacterium]|nr:hypothetical protein [Opitutales bacterium]